MKDGITTNQNKIFLFLACILQSVTLLLIFFNYTSAFKELPWGIGPGDHMILGTFALPFTFIWGICIAKANRRLKVLNIVTIISQFLIFGSYLFCIFVAFIFDKLFNEPISIRFLFYDVYTVCSFIAIAFTLILIDAMKCFIRNI